MNRTVILFAKAPVPGQVKTRLQSVLSPERCAELARALLTDTAAALRQVSAERKVVAFSPQEAGMALRQIVGSGFDYTPQIEGDLGRRMAAAFEDAFGSGAEATVIVGADSPAVPPSWISDAFDSLSSHDLVLGPTADCGYYLIGLRKPVTALFENIEWSTTEVLPRTLEIAERLKLRLRLLPPWVDLDTPETLEFFRSHVNGLELAGDPTLPLACAAFFAQLSPVYQSK